MRRFPFMILAILLPLAFFIPLSHGNTAPAPSGLSFMIDRVEEGIASICSEDGRSFFIPEAALGQPLDAGACVLLDASPAQSLASERLTRLELKAGDLLDDM